MNYCTTCKINYPPTKKFCRQCGSPLTEKREQTSTPMSSMRCPACNSEITPGKKFCRYCGAALGSISPSDVSAEDRTEALCPGCGNPTNKGRKLCGKCGLSLSPLTEEAIVPAQASQSAAQVAPLRSTAVSRETVGVAPFHSSFAGVEGAAIKSQTPAPFVAGSVLTESLFESPPVVATGKPVASQVEEPSLPRVIAFSPSTAPQAVTPAEPHGQPWAILKKHLWKIATGFCVLLLMLATLLWLVVLSPSAKIRRAIDRGDLATPVGASAYDFYQTSKTRLSDGARTRIRNKALPKLLDAANTMMQKRMQGESMSLSDVEQLMRLYGWAAELAPAERRGLAGRDYATALSMSIAGNARGALPLLLQSTAEDPTWAPAFNELGKTYVKLNDHNHAAEAYQRATANNPTWPFPELNLGGVYLHNRQWDLAEQSYLRAIQLDSTLATPWYFLAQVYEAQKRFADAINAYEKALQLAATRPSSAFRPDRVQQRIEKLKAGM